MGGEVGRGENSVTRQRKECDSDLCRLLKSIDMEEKDKGQGLAESKHRNYVPFVLHF